MSRHSFKVLIAMLLSICLISSIAGCKKKQSQQTDTMNDEQPTSLNSNVTTQTVDEESPSYGMGNYVEHSYKLPLIIGNSFPVYSILPASDLNQGGDSLTISVFDQKLCLDENGEWSQTPINWMSKDLEAPYLSSVPLISEDGNEYYLCQKEQDGAISSCIVQKIGDTLTELSLPSKYLPKEITNYIDPVKGFVTKDGEFILTHYDSVQYINKKGTLLNEWYNVCGYVSTITNNQLFVLNDSMDSLDVYDLQSYELSYSISVKDLKLQNGVSQPAALTCDTDNNIYLQCSNGIFKLSSGATTFTQIVDSAIISGSSNENFPYSLSIDENGNIANIRLSIQLTDWTLYYYTYDSNVSSTPQKKLTIYSVYDIPEIHSAISKYQTEHPDVYVDYSVAASRMDPDFSIRDYLDNLYSQLLAGGGPDILYLDELDAKALMEKDVLENITEPVVNNSDLCESIKYSFTKDGQIYAIPSRIQIPVFSGSTEVLQAAATSETLANYAKDSATPLFGGIPGGFLLHYLYVVYQNEIYNEDLTVNPDKVRSLLENIKIVYDNSYISNETSYTSTLYNLKDSQSALGMTLLSSVDSIRELIGLMKFSNTPMTTINQCYIPANILSINRNSKMKEEALNFMEAILSEETQAKDMYEGIAVNMKTVPNNQIDYNPMNRGGNYYSYMDLNGQNIDVVIEYPTKEEAQTYCALYEEISNPYIVDRALDSTIFESMYCYVMGEQTIDEVMSSITSFLNLYSAE